MRVDDNSNACGALSLGSGLAATDLCDGVGPVFVHLTRECLSHIQSLVTASVSIFTDYCSNNQQVYFRCPTGILAASRPSVELINS